jgi:replication factor C small subunit
MAQQLWVEKYRPAKVSDYVWRDARQKNQILGWIRDKSIPHLLLSGTQGLGKTSLINVLLSEIGVEGGDILEINASEETSVDTVRTKIINFASSIPFGTFKVIVLEEAEAMSAASQAALKRVIEDYSEDCRFILTTNTPHKIIPPIHSRCQTFHMTSLDKDEFRLRLAHILTNENIEADVETLDNYIEATYPDLRKAINSIQLNCVDGRLLSPTDDSREHGEWMIKMVELFKAGKITEAREYVCSHADYTDYPEIYRYLYRNLGIWGSSEQQKEDAIIAIRDGLVKDSMVADREINLSATLVTLKNIKNGSK